MKGAHQRVAIGRNAILASGRRWRLMGTASAASNTKELVAGARTIIFHHIISTSSHNTSLTRSQAPLTTQTHHNRN